MAVLALRKKLQTSVRVFRIPSSRRLSSHSRRASKIRCSASSAGSDYDGLEGSLHTGALGTIVRRTRRRSSATGDWRGDYKGTGRVGLFLDGGNATAFGTFGDCASAAKAAQRCGLPWYRFAHEIVPNVWKCVEIPTVVAPGTATIAHASSYGIYKPMARVRFDDAANVGSTAYPVTVLNAVQKFNLDTKSSSIVRLGAVIGFTGDNCGVIRVQILDSANNDITATLATYLLIGTAAQGVARGQIPSTQLIANGGVLNPDWYVIGSSANDVIRLNANRHRHVPILDDPAIVGSAPVGGYRIWLTNTLAKGAQQNTSTTVDRSYPLYVTYGTAAMTETTANTTLYLMRDLGARNDASANETATLSGFITGSGHADSGATGGGHGYEDQTAITLSIDGVAQVLYARTLTRARTSNVATLVFDRSITSVAGELITSSAMSGTGYNLEGVAITAVSTTTLPNDTITFPCTGIDEATIADTGGQFISHKFVVGTSNVKILRSSNFRHPAEGATVVATGQVTYLLSALGYFDTTPRITLSVNYTLTSASYGALRTFFGADRATYGAEYVGKAKIRQLSGGAATYLDTNDNSEVMVGETIGYAGYSDGGVGQVVEFIDPTTGVVKIFMQDSLVASGPQNHDKFYMRMASASTAHAANDNFGYTTRLWLAPVWRNPAVYGT